MKAMILAGAIAALSGAALGQGVIINEILGSTESTDREFIEILNNGTVAVDITGWSIALYDSDNGPSFGGTDGVSPYFVTGNVILNPGEMYVWGNSTAQTAYAGGSYAGDFFAFDDTLPANAIENSAYTAILEDALGNNMFSVYVADGGVGDGPNEAGAAIVPNAVAGPDGTFLPAGFAMLDKSYNVQFLNFNYADQNNGTIAGGTPGVNQKIPTPGALALAGVAGLAATRRRR